ncbi:MAG: hypothetical protein QXH34_06455 [Ignisphaera sp.]
MSDLPVFTITSENKIIKSTADQLEKMLREYYTKFKTMLIGGLILVITGFILLLVNSGGDWLVHSALFSLTGVVLIIVSFARKVRIKEMDVFLYPVLVAPYDDGSKSLVVDILNLSGDEVEFKYPRVDLLRDKLYHHLDMLKKSANFLINLNEQEPSSTIEFQLPLENDRETAMITTLHLELSMEKESKEAQETQILESVKHDRPSFRPFNSPTIALPSIIGQEFTKTTTLYPELPVVIELKKIQETLASREYDNFSFRLFKSGITISAHPLRLISKDSLLVEDMEERIKENIYKINSLLETLKIEYSDLLETVVTEVTKAKSNIMDYYNELDALIGTIRELMMRAIEAPKIRVCPSCYVDSINNILLSSSYPTLLKHDIEKGGVLVYKCPKCGSFYYEYLGLRVANDEPIRLYWLDILQSKTWSRLYETRLDEINRYISEARKQKSDAYHEAMRQIHAFMHQFKSQLMPVYVDLNKVLNEIQANSFMLSKVSSIVPEGTVLCEKFDLSQKVIDIYEKSRRVLIEGNVDEALKERTDVMKRLRKAKTLKIDSVYLNEVALKTLIKAHKILGRSNEAQQISEILVKKDFEELERFLKQS